MKQHNECARSPTLETVLMVEQTIKEHSGEYNKTQLWKLLPRKVMWQTYLYILNYLEDTQRIARDREERIAYIWNPELMKKLRERSEIRL